ncbi:MAG: hypothetical protein M4579_006522 [Chaenotheca gracillima]|nr:MAG: hypothetical protein M4579_006522 [Chaenotheca gracillima]
MDALQRRRRSGAPSPIPPASLSSNSDYCPSSEAESSESEYGGRLESPPAAPSPVSASPSPDQDLSSSTADNDDENSDDETSTDDMAGYIARVRYENPLPPPSFPPKLLDVPGTGLASSDYLTPGYATRLWRDQPLNVEADAELGMPLNLVGMPGIFDGDESSIQAPDHPPAIDPRDKPILRKPTQLGKPTSTANSVSFLRRTEYISNEINRNRADANRQARATGSGRKRRQSEISRDDPINILKTIVKGFDIAHPDEAYTGPDTASHIRGHKPTAAELEAWNNPVHPTKKHLKVLDSYPVLPDLDAFPDSGGYMIMKFATNPLAKSDAYDTRMDVGVLRPLELRPDIQATHQASVDAHRIDPNAPAPGPPPFDYEFSIPQDNDAVWDVKKAFSVPTPADASTATEGNEKTFRYARVRTYETAQTSGSFHNRYDEIALALHDPSPNLDSTSPQKQKGAYYYPILQKSQIRQRRMAVTQRMGTNMGMMSSQHQEDPEDKEGRVDFLEITVRDPDEAEALRRAEHRSACDVLAYANADADADGDEDAEGDVELEETKEELDDDLKPVESVEAAE